jgi:ABC-type Zn2+ transport system substrate-binding protein/surface adhesin
MGRKKSLSTIENEMALIQEAVVKSKARYEKNLKKLEEAMARRDELMAKELFAAFKQSGKPYPTVMRYLKEGMRQ